MEKQRAVNTVTANDEYSQNLMKMYENWMDGDTFQGSYKGEVVKEDEIPTGQKQGGGDGAAFKTAIGELPAIELDKSTSIPVIPELGVTDNTEKNTKTHDSANDGGPPVALKGSMTIGQGSLSSGDKQTHGAAIRDTTLVARESKECCKKCGSYEHTTEDCKATKEQVESYLWDQQAAILTMIGEETGVKYKVVPLEEHHEKDKDGNVIPHEVKEDTEAAKSLRAKKVAKIMSYKK